MDFFKDLESVNTNKLTGLRAGKAAEQSEFESLLKEVELELDQASARSASLARAEEPAVAEVEAPTTATAVAATVDEKEAPPAVVEEDGAAPSE